MKLSLMTFDDTLAVEVVPQKDVPLQEDLRQVYR